MSPGHRRSALLLSAATGLFGWVVIAAAPASASCALPPQPSPHAFVGRVLATELEGRVATVLTSDGEHVQVVGTPYPDSVTSVDREYVVGATYEFHPQDAETDPYEDNACTATQRLRGDDIPASLRGGVTGADVTAEPVSQSNDTTAAGAVVGGVAVAGVASVVVWLRRRRGLQGF